jgi:5-(carboxyamino)imidazole ribonucleotide mutase
MTHQSSDAIVGIIMGSRSDWDALAPARDTLAQLGVPYDARVLSAHRMPDETFEYASTAKERGLRVIIAAAGGAAHLPGVVAAKTMLPVIGVPMQTKALKGVDSFLSMVQMPAGVPVATMAIGGALNAALFAARIVALHDERVALSLAEYARTIHDAAAQSTPV